MADTPTLVSTRLAARLNPSVREQLSDLEVRAAQRRFALALDDAGVAEAMEKLREAEMIAGGGGRVMYSTIRDFKDISKLLRSALAALTGPAIDKLPRRV